MTSVADIRSFQRFTSAMPQKLTKAADAGKARKSEDSCGGRASYLQAVCRTPAIGAAFSINFRSRHPFPSKAKVDLKSERPVDMTGPNH
ncbi:hypothetical protein [Rhizobium lusitanum]|uniref:Uncharacterized protein n=1 Tax=Rhizobium lusitanum TaxID=293958 RepID=A0A7X0MC06_9HYPH|nr:hypothetical protein [Rhizobium lusitanum]MBB6485317.1 hypothetical protein [Rhizobium lusitanum]